MTPLNCLCCAARHAKKLKSNYVVASRNGMAVFQGTDLREAKDLDGAVLYFFCEPGLSELVLASAAGVKAVYYGISKHDALRHGLYSAHLRPKAIQRVRPQIIEDYARSWRVPDMR